MANDRKREASEQLREAFGGAPPAPEPEMSEYGRRLAVATREAVLHLRAKQLLEVEDGALEALVSECVEAGLESRSPKQVPRRLIRALSASDHADEVYGTDDELEAELRSFFGI